MNRKSTAKTGSEEVMVLPKGVTSRVLFQCGPEGEDPLVDEIETKHRKDGVVIVQSTATYVTIRANSNEPIPAVKTQIVEWLNALIYVRLRIDDLSDDLRDTLSYECTHFLNKKPWICSVVFKRDAVRISGHESAVNECCERIVALTQGLNVSKFVDSVVKAPTSVKETGWVPQYRLGGNGPDWLKRHIQESISADVSHAEEQSLLPVSIFDSLDIVPSPTPLAPEQVEVFKRTIKVDGIAEVPVLVIKRIEETLGAGARIWFGEDRILNIVVSSSESSLDVAEAMLNICAKREVIPKHSFVSLTVNLPPRSPPVTRDKLLQWEKTWNVVIVRGRADGSTLIILGRDALSRKGCEIEIIRHCGLGFRDPAIQEGRDVLNDGEPGFAYDYFVTLGSVLARMGGGASMVCHQAAVSSGTVVERVGSVLCIAGDRKQRIFARECVEWLLAPSEPMSSFPALHALVVPVPKSFVAKGLQSILHTMSRTKKTLKSLEKDFSCAILINTHLAGGDTFIQPRVSADEVAMVTILSLSGMGRIGAAVELIASAERSVADRRLGPTKQVRFYDSKSIRTDVHGVHVCTIELSDGQSIHKQTLGDLSAALEVVVEVVDRTTLVIAGQRREATLAAVEVVKRLLGRPYWTGGSQSVWVDFVTDVSLPVDILQLINTWLGTLCLQNEGSVSVIAASELRRRLAILVISAPKPQGMLDAVRMGWQGRRSKLREVKLQKRRERAPRLAACKARRDQADTAQSDSSSDDGSSSNWSTPSG